MLEDIKHLLYAVLIVGLGFTVVILGPILLATGTVILAIVGVFLLLKADPDDDQSKD